MFCTAFTYLWNIFLLDIITTVIKSSVVIFSRNALYYHNFHHEQAYKGTTFSDTFPSALLSTKTVCPLRKVYFGEQSKRIRSAFSSTVSGCLIKTCPAWIPRLGFLIFSAKLASIMVDMTVFTRIPTGFSVKAREWFIDVIARFVML